MTKAVHELKSWPQLFGPMVELQKQFDVRQNDRHYRVGDVICFKEYDPDTGKYSGREIWRRITYVLRSFAGVHPDYVVLGLEEAPTGG